jgi:predicted nucleic acid-binding protein
MLVDAGPLVSLCDRNQPAYTRCRAILEASAVPLISTWPCFVEAMYLVGRIGGLPMQQHLWTLLDRGILQFHDHNAEECKRMAQLMSRYQNVPMDLADASLVTVAEAINDLSVFTLDSDFHVYRLADGRAFNVVLT